jgi:hypothetical protein
MKPIRHFYLLPFTLSLLISCDSGDIYTGQTADDTPPTPFYDKVQAVFDAACTSCHGERAAAGLRLDEGNSRASLVGIQSSRSEKIRVVPYSVEESFLIDVLTDANTGLKQPHTTILYEDDMELLKIWIGTGAE